MKAVEELKSKAPEVVELSKRESLDLLSWLTQIKSLEREHRHGQQVLDLMMAGLREKYRVDEDWSWDTKEGTLTPPEEKNNGE